jgi:hypothetical protein
MGSLELKGKSNIQVERLRGVRIQHEAKFNPTFGVLNRANTGSPNRIIGKPVQFIYLNKLA